MARALSAVERREYVRAVIRITRHQGRLTTSEAMKRLGLSRATVQRYFSEAEATGEVVRHGRLGLFRDQRAVIGKNEFYHKETGRRHFAESTRRRLLLDTIKPIEVKHV